MRNSRAQSEIDKIIYPKCTFKKQHLKQQLSYICLTKTCKFAGVICGLCKTKDHVNHQVVPFKWFIQNVSSSFSCKSQLQKIEQEIIINSTQGQKQLLNSSKTIQQIHIEMMSMLKIQVTQLSKMIEQCEDRLIKKYEMTKIQLSEEVNKKQILNQLLVKLSQNNFEDPVQYRMNVKRLCKLINVSPKNQITIKKQQDLIVNRFVQEGEKFKDNIYLFQRQLSELLQVIDLKPISQKIQTNKLNRPQTAITSINKPTNHTFSSVYKPLNIVLEKQNKVARLKDNLGSKIVCFSQPVTGKIQQARIKILSIGPNSSILIGVCLRQKVKLKAYKFEKSPIGHGCYVVSSNNLKYSNTDGKQNALGGFTFLVNEQLTIMVDHLKSKVIFKKKSDQKNVLQMNLKLKDSEIKQLSFCAILSQSTDKVMII